MTHYWTAHLKVVKMANCELFLSTVKKEDKSMTYNLKHKAK